jgi:hypothetical protein
MGVVIILQGVGLRVDESRKNRKAGRLVSLQLLQGLFDVGPLVLISALHRLGLLG